MKQQINVFRICLLALAICINLAGGQLALVLRLPIYLDSIGTIMAGALCGPVYGMLPSLLSGIIMGMTTDIYSLYFAPAGMAVGLMSGLMWKRKSSAGWWPALAALVITVPGTLLSSLICAKLFGGITSSGSTILVQLLAKTPLGMTASVFVVQVATEYLDRLIAILLVSRLLQVLPKRLMASVCNKTADRTM